MTKRITLLAVFALLLVFGCGKYSDIRSLSDDMYAVNELYISGMENAKGPADVAATLNQYTDKMETLIPRIKEIQTKYPEVDFRHRKFPDELSDVQKKQNEQTDKMKAASQKLTKYMMDQQVMKAVMKLGMVMSKMQ